jgi:hypothetical protein
MFKGLKAELGIETLSQLDGLSADIVKTELQRLGIPALGLKLNSAHSGAGFKQQCQAILDIAKAWPSAGLVAVMHMHVLLALSRYSAMIPSAKGVLAQVENAQALLASLSAEGSEDANHAPLLHHKISPDRYMINGVKKPASLSHMADFFICVSRAQKLTEQGQIKPDTAAPAIVLIPRSDAVTVNQTLWKIAPFNAADSHSVSFNEVMLSADEIALELTTITPFTSLALGTFQVMTMACYLGIANCLITKISRQFKPYYELRASMARINMFHETVLPILCEQGFKTDTDAGALAFVQATRYSLERDLSELVSLIYKHMSANALVMDQDYLHLMNTLMMLRFHPMGEKQYLRGYMPDFPAA